MRVPSPKGNRIARQIEQVRAFINAGPAAPMLERMARAEAISAAYDAIAARPVRHGGYMNFGYWQPGTTSIAVASDQLMERLLERCPTRCGRVLDVGCGLGATTRYLRDRWQAGSVVAINVTRPQLNRCRDLAPGCLRVQADAAALPMADASFRYIVCIEAALHFRTRESFLRHALRSLEPGGMLVMSDLLLHAEGHQWLGELMPRDNYLSSPSAYADLLRGVGFANVEVHDITDRGWSSFARFELSHAHESWLNGRNDFSQLLSRCAFVYSGAAAYSYNVLCFAER